MQAFGKVLLAVAVAVAGFAATAPLVDREVHDHRNHVHKEAERSTALAAAARAAVPATRLSDVECVRGQAGPFDCDGVDLLSFVPAREFAGPETDPLTSDDFGPDGVGGLSDLWGWTDPVARDDGTHDEYVILGKTNGVAFFRVTDPFDPEYLGELPNTSPAQLVWHDIKVHDDHAFIVSESVAHGMQVFDLRQLRDVRGGGPQLFTPTFHYPLNSSAHNIAIDTEAGFAYLLGENIGIAVQTPCSLHIVDLSEPSLPIPAGCWPGERGDLPLRAFQYVHDAHCTVYRGPDADHQGKQICLGSNEVNLSIIDVTDKLNPVLLSQIPYPDVAYAHQGWLSADHRFFFLGDELDEVDFGLPTRTLVFDVRDLDNPSLHFERLHGSRSADHNMYVDGPLLYQSNYTSGLRVLDTTHVETRALPEIAFFDTFPLDDAEPIPIFSGTWSNYPYFESGTIAVSGMDEGLFLLRLQKTALDKVGGPLPPGDGGGPPDGLPPPGDPATQQVFFAIRCEPGSDGATCASTTHTLSAEPGTHSVGTLGSLTPLNEALFLVDGSEPTTLYGADRTLAASYRLRSDEPVRGQVALRSFEDDMVGAGLTTVYVELTARRTDGRRVHLGNATVTQPLLPGGPTVFPFAIDLPADVDGLEVTNLSAGVAVRGANVLAGFTDGEGGSFLRLPYYRR